MFDTVHQQIQLSVYQVARTPYQTLRAEIEHGHWAISHVRVGDVETQTQGEKHRASQGTVMVHPPSLPYAEYAEVLGMHEWMVFECAVHPGLDLFCYYPVPAVVPIGDPDAFSALFSLLLAAWEAPFSSFRDLRVSSLTTQLLSLILENWQVMGRPMRSLGLLTAQDRFTGLIIYLSQHLSQKLSREDLAAFVHLQPNYLDRVFRQTYGVAPMQMLRDLRLQRARYLLETTDRTVSSIAELCGFDDAAYFTRVFRRQMGLSPGRHRQSVRDARRSYSPIEEA